MTLKPKDAVQTRLKRLIREQVLAPSSEWRKTTFQRVDQAVEALGDLQVILADPKPVYGLRRENPKLKKARRKLKEAFYKLRIDSFYLASLRIREGLPKRKIRLTPLLDELDRLEGSANITLHSLLLIATIDQFSRFSKRRSKYPNFVSVLDEEDFSASLVKCVPKLAQALKSEKGLSITRLIRTPDGVDRNIVFVEIPLPENVSEARAAAKFIIRRFQEEGILLQEIEMIEFGRPKVPKSPRSEVREKGSEKLKVKSEEENPFFSAPPNFSLFIPHSTLLFRAEVRSEGKERGSETFSLKDAFVNYSETIRKELEQGMLAQLTVLLAVALAQDQLKLKFTDFGTALAWLIENFPLRKGTPEENVHLVDETRYEKVSELLAMADVINDLNLESYLKGALLLLLLPFVREKPEDAGKIVRDRFAQLELQILLKVEQALKARPDISTKADRQKVDPALNTISQEHPNLATHEVIVALARQAGWEQNGRGYIGHLIQTSYNISVHRLWVVLKILNGIIEEKKKTEEEASNKRGQASPSRRAEVRSGEERQPELDEKEARAFAGKLADQFTKDFVRIEAVARKLAAGKIGKAGQKRLKVISLRSLKLTRAMQAFIPQRSGISESERIVHRSFFSGGDAFDLLNEGPVRWYGWVEVIDVESKISPEVLKKFHKSFDTVRMILRVLSGYARGETLPGLTRDTSGEWILNFPPVLEETEKRAEIRLETVRRVAERLLGRIYRPEDLVKFPELFMVPQAVAGEAVPQAGAFRTIASAVIARSEAGGRATKQSPTLRLLRPQLNAALAMTIRQTDAKTVFVVGPEMFAKAGAILVALGQQRGQSPLPEIFVVAPEDTAKASVAGQAAVQLNKLLPPASQIRVLQAPFIKARLGSGKFGRIQPLGLEGDGALLRRALSDSGLNWEQIWPEVRAQTQTYLSYYSEAFADTLSRYAELYRALESAA